MAHYVATFQMFLSNSNDEHSKLVSGFSPFEYKERLSVQARLEYIEFLLDIYKKDISNVVGLVGDNCSVNLSLATKFKTSFIGCASHRYKLAL